MCSSDLLARVLTGAEGGNPTLGMNPTFAKLPCETGKAFAVVTPPGLLGEKLFVGGVGEVHIYGPYVVPYLFTGEE